MTARADFLAVLLRNQRRVDAERREFARRVNEVVVRHNSGRETFDPLAYTLITRELDVVFSEFYGRGIGDTNARFYRLIVDECRLAQQLAVRRAIEDIRRRVPEPIWRAIEQEAA